MSVITLNPRTRRPGPFPPDRRCAEAGCVTLLCRWDPGPKCFTHSEPERISTVEAMKDLADLMEAA